MFQKALVHSNAKTNPAWTSEVEIEWTAPSSMQGHLDFK